MSDINCQCSCGQVQLVLSEAPCARFQCHCEICQQVYAGPQADVTVARCRSVAIANPTAIEYRSYWSSLKRGVCRQCREPVIAWLPLLPFYKVALIPAQTYPEDAVLPQVKAHIFYHRRQRDARDLAPKVSGFVRSELMAMWVIVRGLLKRSGG